MNKLYIYVNINDHRTSVYKAPPKELMKELGWLVRDVNEIDFNDKDGFISYLEENKIKAILMFWQYHLLIYSFDKYLNDNSIKVLMYQNDLHSLPGRERVNSIADNFKNHWLQFDNIYMCANYYYCVNKYFNIDQKRVIEYPAFADEDFKVDFNNNPNEKILLSGSKTMHYPARKKLYRLMDTYNRIECLKHGELKGHDYIKHLNKYLCCFTCCANPDTPYIVGKFFEIPSSGSLLLAYDEHVKEPLEKLGFVDGVNYISCTIQNMEEKLNWIFDPNNLDQINLIRKNGYDLVWKKHKQGDRLKYITDLLDKN